MSDAPRLVSMRFLRALVDAAENLGVERARALAACGANEAELADDAGWITAARMTHAWESIPALSKDACFGIHAAERTPLGMYGPLDLATMSSANVGEAMTRMARYYRSMGAMSDVRVTRRDDGSMRLEVRPLVWSARGGKSDLRQYVEHMFTLVAVRIRMAATLRGADVDLAVKFAHAAPDETAEHARVMGPRVGFGAKTNELVVAAKTAALPLRTADPELSAMLEREAARKALRPDDPIDVRVRAAIEQGLREGDASLDAVAKKLALGPRTIQRSLQREKTSYADVLDAVRRDVALAAVKDGKVALGELSYTLGFAQPSAFYRAFKRWTGLSPAEWRTSE